MSDEAAKTDKTDILVKLQPESSDARVKQLEAELASLNRLTKAAETEIERVWKVYSRITTLLGIFIALVVAVIGLLGWKTYREILDEVRNAAKLKIDQRIDAEFETERIRQTISQVASNEAKGLLISQIIPEVRLFEQTITNQISSIRDISSNAVAVVAELEGQASFLNVMNSAIAGSRSNYMQLVNWAKDSKSPFAGQAMKSKFIAAKLNFFSPFGPRFKPQWNAGRDPAKLSIAQLISAYHESTFHFGGPVIEIIWGREDIAKQLRMQFLISVIEEGEDLNAVYTAINFFATEAGLDANSEEFEIYSEWWKANKDKIK